MIESEIIDTTAIGRIAAGTVGGLIKSERRDN